MTTTKSEERNRAEGWEKTYQEVLAADKHQDDKIGRLLIALAFLTAASATLFVHLRKEADPFTVHQSGPDATNLFFCVFLVAVALALLTALSAGGPASPLRLACAPHPEPSILYFAAIARRSKQEWEHETKDLDVWGELANNFRRETRGIAGRVNYKLARVKEANAFLQLAVICLLLMGIAGTAGLGDRARWWMVAVVLAFGLLVPFWELRQMKRLGFPEDASTCAYVRLGFGVAIAAVVIVTARTFEHEWFAMYLALFDILAIRLSIVTRHLANFLLWMTVLAGIGVGIGVLLT